MTPAQRDGVSTSTNAPLFVRIIICLEVAWLLLVCALTPLRTGLSTWAVMRPYLLPLAAAVALLVSLGVSRRTQLLVVLGTLPAALVLLPLEAVLEAPSHRLQRAYTRRAQLPVVRVNGLRVFPILAPWDLAYGHRTLRISDSEGLPLTGLPNRLTGICSRKDSELVFRSDQHGFRNPGGDSDSSVVQAVIIGDSFAQGYCVSNGESIAGHLAARFGSVMNFGVTGAGPLWELGVLREYAAMHKPRAIVWAFFEEDDLEGIDAERSGFAGKYLDPAFSQNLSARQPAVDKTLNSRLDSLANSFDPAPLERLRRLVLLREIRARLSLSLRPPEVGLARSGSPVDRDLPVLKQALTIARNEAAAWGGRILFVYLPERTRYTTALRNTQESKVRGHHSAHPRVVAMVDSLGIPVLDLVPAFAAQREPLTLWDEGAVHYNAAGYRLVADSIIAALSRERRMMSANRRDTVASDWWIQFPALSAKSISRSHQ